MNVNIYQAKTNFSRLVNDVMHGKEIIISKAGQPVARLVPFRPGAQIRKPGYWRGKVIITKDFDELPPELLSIFNGE